MAGGEVSGKLGRSILFPFLLGLLTALTQTILIRELMIATGAFELVVAVALSLWMLFTGIGSISFRFFPFLQRGKVLPFLLIALSLAAVGQLFLIAPLAASFSPVAGMALSIPAMVAVAALVIIPGCILGGLAFPACVEAARDRREPTGAVYLMESGGMAAGALLFYLFLDLFSPVNYPVYRDHYAARYFPDTLLFSRDGRYGRLDATEREGQRAYFRNGQAAGVAGENRPAEEFAGLVLTQHPAPHRIAVIGGLLSGSAVALAARMPHATITVIEQEPMLFEIYPTDIFGKNVILRSGEPVAVMTALPPQELIIIDLPDPSSVMLSRFFSREFFHFLREHNGPGAVIVVGLSGGRGMLAPETAALNRSVQKALQEVFREVVLVPADHHLWAAADNDFPTADPAVVIERMERNRLNGTWFNGALVQDIFEPMRRQLTTAAVKRAATRENRLLTPAAYFETLRHTARRLGAPLPAVITALPARPLFFFLITGAFATLCAAGIAFFFRRRMAPAQSGAIFCVSGSAFVLQLALMTLLQVQVGQIYHFIALFTVSFMLGTTAGVSVSRMISYSSLLPIAALALLATALLWVADRSLGATGYVALDLIVGLLGGLSIGNLTRNYGKERSSGTAFYVADLAGAALCGLLFGAAILPLYDLRSSIAAAGVLALIGMFAALVMPRGQPGR